MGGWISLLLAREMPERIASLVTIAAAPDFTEDSMWRLIDEGRDRLVLRDPLALPFPTRFLQGTADKDVAMSVALRLLDHAEGPDMQLTLVDGADHVSG